MLRQVSILGFSLLLSAGLSACDNDATYTRDAKTPQVVEWSNVKVTVYRAETHLETGGPCGYNQVGSTLVPITCEVTEDVADRTEMLNFRVHFPAGSELTGDEKETIKASFYNDDQNPKENYGYISGRIHSKFHRYQEIKDHQVFYNTVNDIYVELK